MPSTQVNYDDVHLKSVEILELLQGETAAVGASACALSLGRIISPRTMPLAEEVKVIQSMVEFAASTVDPSGSAKVVES